MSDGRRSTLAKYTWMLLLAGIAAILGYLVATAWHGSRSIFVSGRNPAAQIVSLLFDGGKLIGESRGQVNVLLLGIGGAGHDGPYLSDTIILAGIKPDGHEVSLFSIPRDTLITIPGITGQYKINHAYALAAAKYGPKGGLAQAREVVSNLTGLDIPYAVAVDFAGFEKAVDDLGGIDVQIDKTFTDAYYPDDKFGYLPPLTFNAGVEHMDGERALIYARSRHSTSDFDRARRQQRIIEAFKARLSELNLITNLGTINKLFGAFAAHVFTNLDPAEVKRLAQIASGIPQDKIYTSVLDPTTGLVCSYLSKENGYYLNTCPGKNKQDIYEFVEASWSRGHLAWEKPIVEVQNATGQGGLALAASEQLKNLGITASFANAAQLTNNSQTVVYDLTKGQKPDSLAVLLVTFSARKGDIAPASRTSANPEFIVIIGNDYRPPVLDVINLDPETEPNATTTQNILPVTKRSSSTPVK